MHPQADRSRGQEPDRRLDWSPIRDVPEAFGRAVEAGQKALARVLDEETDESLAALVEIWEGIIADPRLSESPLPFRLDMLNRSAIALWWQTRYVSLEGTTTALARWDEALALAPAGWDDRARYLTNAAGVHLQRFQLGGDRTGLQRAVEAALDAVAGCPPNAPLAALVRYRAADALGVRHRQYGDAGDIERAIRFAEESVDAGAAHRSSRLDLYLSKLAEMLAWRFDAYGSVDDLERAIEAQERAIAHAAGQRDRDTRQAALGRLLRQRWVVLHQPVDIERAVELLRAAPAEGVNAPSRLTNLGNALLDRYSLRDDVADLRDALAAHERAVELTNPGDWQLAARYNNAGNSALALFEATLEPTALAHAVEHYERSISLTAATAREMASRQYNLGNALRAVHDHGGTEDDARRAGDAYRAACVAGMLRDLNWALGASLAWGAWSDRRRAADEAAAAYRYGLDAMSELFRRQLEREDKEVWLRHAEGLPARASAALVRVGDRSEAVLALERGRALLLSEALQRDRAALGELERRGQRDLARRYVAAAQRLRHA